MKKIFTLLLALIILCGVGACRSSRVIPHDSKVSPGPQLVEPPDCDDKKG